MEYLQITLILVFGFLFRLAFATGESSDEWVSFWLIKRQKGRKWVNYEVDDSLLPGIYGYPVFQHFLVSRFPERLWGWVGRLSNALYDVLTAGCVFLFGRAICSRVGIEAPIAGLETAAAAALLFLTTPALLPITSRMATIKGRSMGLLLSTVYFGSLGLTMVLGTWHYLFLTSAAGLLIILSSLFAIQVMVGFSLILSVFTGSFVPILATALVLALAFVLPIGTREVLSFTWHHKIWYWRNQGRETTASGRNRLEDILKLPIHLFTNFTKFSILCVTKITPIIALYNSPIIFLIAWVWIARGYNALAFGDVPEMHYLNGLILASAVSFVLTSLPKLVFLGDADRYFEYSAPAFSIVCALLLSLSEAGDGLLWVLILVHAIGIFLNLLYLRRSALGRYRADTSTELREAAEWLAREDRDARVLTVPCKLAYVVAAMHRPEQTNGLSYYYRFIKRPGETGFRYFEQDTGGMLRNVDGWTRSFEIFSAPPGRLRVQYGATHLLVGASHVEGLRRTWDRTDARLLDSPVYSNARYCIYALSSDGSSNSEHGGAPVEQDKTEACE